MIDLAINNLNKFYGSNHVIKDFSFEIYSGEKVALLGKNGSGKTTLFKTITGEEPYESGTISKASNKKIEMLAQIPVFGEADTCEDILRSSFWEVNEIYKEMKKIEGDGEPAALARYGCLMEDYERLGGYDTEVRLDKICSGMNINERLRNSLFKALSGGEKTRVNLARILLRDCEILLLDEPTNHLDLVSIEWLEEFLHDFLGTVVVISHDRVFLDKVVTRIIEIEDGKANFFSGNYSFYAEERQQRFLTQAEQYKQQQRKIKQLEAAIKRQRVWAQINPSNTGLAKRALAMEKRIEQMDKVSKPNTARKLTGEFESGSHTSKDIVSLNCVSKSYGAKALMHQLSIKIHRNDRIALVGPNGCGKTTLIKMIMGEEQPDDGELVVSPSANIAYMPQIISFDDDHATVLDTLRSENILSEEIARSILARFHFTAADVMKKVGSLSGGEKSRLKLCLMMQKNVTLLLLDEPTNHLDIESREWIENALSEFDGTMLFVSHDRYFLNQFADQVWCMENGAITQYEYGYDQYLDALHKDVISEKAPSKKKKTQPPKVKTDNTPKSSASGSIELLINEAESELKEVDAEIQADVLRFDFSKMNELVDKKNRLTEQINRLYDEWAKQ